MLLKPMTVPGKNKRLLGWIGASCLLLILPLKTLRWSDQFAGSTVVGIGPSALGTAGLLFIILSGSGRRLSRLTLLQSTVLAGAVAMGLEFAQLIPRPGILARVRYTFDWLDVAATLVSLVAGYAVARLLVSRENEYPGNPVTPSPGGRGNHGKEE